MPEGRSGPDGRGSPSISVVIPTFNYGRFVATAVESALAQTAPPCEVIVIDDGSTDDTKARLERFAGRIRYCYQENRGLSAARNVGLALATGDWVALLDSDDVWHARKLERQLPVLRAHPEAGLVACASLLFPDEGELGPFLAGEPPARGLVDVGFRQLLGDRRFRPSSVLLRKSVAVEVGGFDESLRSVEDLDMWLRIRAGFPVLMLETVLAAVRSHHASMSRRLEPMRSSHETVLRKAFASIPALRADGTARRLAWARFYRHTALMRREAGDQWGALFDLGRSALRWPFALRRGDGTKARGYRLKMALGALLRRRRP